MEDWQLGSHAILNLYATACRHLNVGWCKAFYLNLLFVGKERPQRLAEVYFLQFGGGCAVADLERKPLVGSP